MKTICFTGRRPKFLCGYASHDAYKSFVDELRQIIRAYYNQGYTRYISGGAQGFDQLAFWAVEGLRNECPLIENIVYLPFVGYGEHWVANGPFGQNEFKLMLSKATQVKYISGEITANSDNGRSTKQIAALMERNHAMVDDADLVIAAYPSDNFTVQKGGTAECMTYAVLKKQKPLLHINYIIEKGILKMNGQKFYGSEIWDEIPVGKCVAHHLTIGFMDDSRSGVELAISARMLVNKGDEIVPEEIQETDMELSEFLTIAPGMTVYAYGHVHIIDELRHIDIDVAPCMFDTIKHLFPKLADITLPIESYTSNVYHIMRDSMHDKWDEQMIDMELSDWMPRDD